MTGMTADGRLETVRIVPDGSAVANYAFDVTPALFLRPHHRARCTSRQPPLDFQRLFPERAVVMADTSGRRRRLAAKRFNERLKR